MFHIILALIFLSKLFTSSRFSAPKLDLIYYFQIIVDQMKMYVLFKSSFAILKATCAYGAKIPTMILIGVTAVGTLPLCLPALD